MVGLGLRSGVVYILAALLYISTSPLPFTAGNTITALSIGCVLEQTVPNRKRALLTSQPIDRVIVIGRTLGAL